MGERSGQLPRSAGIIAIRQVGTGSLVCICEKRCGKRRFPKGGLNRDGGRWETVVRGAKREWHEETGISIRRLQILQGAYIDEASIGTRYLVARCEPADGDSQEPDAARALEWQPPCEDVMTQTQLSRLVGSLYAKYWLAGRG